MLSDIPVARPARLLGRVWAALPLLLLCCLVSPARAEGDPGLELARKVYDRPKGDDASSVVSMVLTSKRAEKRERELVLFAVDKGGRERWSLMRFTLPTDVEGTGLLTMDHPGDDSEQWLYLPALDRVRRISSSRKGGRFVGSDFFYEDLRDREPEMDRHEIAGEEKVGGLKCIKLISTPVDPSESVYTKRIAWIHPDTLLPLRVDYYQKGHKQPTKRLMARKLKKVQGYWTVFDSTMYDLRAGSTTLLATKAIRYDQGIPDSLFSVRGLSDASRQQRYVPR